MWVSLFFCILVWFFMVMLIFFVGILMGLLYVILVIYKFFGVRGLF